MRNARTSVGTLAWAHATGGRLGGSDRFRLLAQALLVRLNLRLRAVNKPPVSVNIGSLRIPDSPLCVAARELVAGVSEPWLVSHCLRTHEAAIERAPELQSRVPVQSRIHFHDASLALCELNGALHREER